MDQPSTSGAEEIKNRTVHEMGHRLDECMDVMFSYLQSVCFNERGEFQVGNTVALFPDLVAAFEKCVIPMSGSCHVQFLLFVMCSYHEVGCFLVVKMVIVIVMVVVGAVAVVAGTVVKLVIMVIMIIAIVAALRRKFDSIRFFLLKNFESQP